MKRPREALPDDFALFRAEMRDVAPQAPVNRVEPSHERPAPLPPFCASITSAKSDSYWSSTRTSRGFVPRFWTTTSSCMPSLTKRSRRTASASSPPTIRAE